MRQISSGGTTWRLLAERSMTPCICAVFHAITMLASKFQRIGHRLHLVGTPRLRCRDAVGVDHALKRVDRLAPVEHPVHVKECVNRSSCNQSGS